MAPGKVIVASKQDPAAVNIVQALVKTFNFQPGDDRYDGEPVLTMGDLALVQIRDDSTRAERLRSYFSPEYYVFVSRHSSAMGLPSLTAHFPGNFGSDTSRGGRPRELAYTFPALLKAYLKRLWDRRSDAPGYQVALEATHHGPTGLDRPVLFVEIGSTEREWRDPAAARLVSRVLMETLSSSPDSGTAGIGLGGPHYSEKFLRILVASDHALGAVASKHVLGSLDDEMLHQMVSKSVQKVEAGFVDWKGLGAQKSSILRMIESEGLKVVRV
jgi:D-aminoacyl-tRNA deacylase